MIYDQREIVLVPFPYSDLSSIEKRPALIVSNQKLNKSQDRLCCLITSVPSKEGIKISKNNLEEGSLKFQSWVKPFRIFSVDKRVIKRTLCRVDSEFHNAVVKMINEYLE